MGGEAVPFVPLIEVGLQPDNISKVVRNNSEINVPIVLKIFIVSTSLISSRREVREECCLAWAGTELKTLQEPDKWDSTVRKKLVEPAQVKEAFSQIVDN